MVHAVLSARMRRAGTAGGAERYLSSSPSPPRPPRCSPAPSSDARPRTRTTAPRRCWVAASSPPERRLPALGGVLTARAGPAGSASPRVGAREGAGPRRGRLAVTGVDGADRRAESAVRKRGGGGSAKMSTLTGYQWPMWVCPAVPVADIVPRGPSGVVGVLGSASRGL